MFGSRTSAIEIDHLCGAIGGRSLQQTSYLIDTSKLARVCNRKMAAYKHNWAPR
jgi:hypothetical protein